MSALRAMPVSAAVMAGGRSSRFGRDKALLLLDGEPLLARAVRLLAPLTDDVLVLGPADRASVAPNAQVVQDGVPGIGPLGGIATALRAALHPAVLVLATDMPLLQPGLLRHLMSLAPNHDVVIPRVFGRTQQLCAVYGRGCLPHIDAQIARGDYKIDRFFPLVRARIVEEEEVRGYDPALLSFRNINTEEDWQSLQALAARR